jgi:hypothetical protein
MNIRISSETDILARNNAVRGGVKQGEVCVAEVKSTCADVEMALCLLCRVGWYKHEVVKFPRMWAHLSSTQFVICNLCCWVRWFMNMVHC